MTSAPSTTTDPLALGADPTALLLDRVVYHQVLECIDLDELYHLEQSLTLLAGDLPDVGPDRAADLARALLDRALRSLPDDVRRYLGAVDFMACDGCEICDEEARHAGRERGGGGGRAPGPGSGTRSGSTRPASRFRS